MSLADELRQLQELHARGALSDEEYAQAKARAIGGAPTSKEAPPPARPRPAPAYRDPAPHREPAPATSSGTGLAVVIVIGLLLVMFAGLFVALNIIPGFLGKGGAGAGGLTLKVDRVESSGDGFRVHMTATNNTKDALRLPLFGYFFVTDDLGNQYKADPFASTFPQDVAPGATVSGYALMEKPLNPRATKLKVAFTTVFGSFAVKSASVENVPVR